LFRRDKYEEVGGLDPELRWAFDLDLLIKLSQVGSTRFIPETLAKFRWHQGSLSVGKRTGSVSEASEVRVAALPKTLRPLSVLWETPIRLLIRFSGRVVHHL
jgi:GT2 family glycosyltransferase